MKMPPQIIHICGGIFIALLFLRTYYILYWNQKGDHTDWVFL